MSPSTGEEKRHEPNHVAVRPPPALALLAPQPRAAARAAADRRPSSSSGTRSCRTPSRRRRRRCAAILRADAHRDVRCDQRHRARVRTVPRATSARRRLARRRGGAGGARRARRPQSAATAAYDALLAAAARRRSRPDSSALRRRGRRRRSRRRSWRGGRTTAGSCRRSRRIPSRRFPGRWQPTPPANAAATFTHVQQAAPLAMVSSTQFLPPPPPILTSARYADGPERSEADRQVDSATRTPEQTAIARLWASIAASGTGTATHYFVDLEQHRPRRRPRAAACRWSRPRGCSC